MQDALFHLPEPDPEHAVLARCRLGGDDLGEPDQWSLVCEAERTMPAHVVLRYGEPAGNVARERIEL
ncbi:hypothetical protein [Streptomyces sp. NPDC001502]|uniref:hypothetical protein n=1 Tax=Streptomyces sp. NPDC001502 TaxID=3364578 RepID=UPI003690F2A4